MSELVAKSTSVLSDTEYQKLSPQDKEAYIKEVIRKTLQLNSSGLTVSQLKDALPYDRRIIEKHLAIMKYTNEIYTVKLGSNVLYIPNHKAMREATSVSKRFGQFEYQVFTLKNRLGEFAVIQQRNATKESQDVMGGIQMPLDDFPEFVSYLRKTITDMENRGVR
jgi:hypothetical protein